MTKWSFTWGCAYWKHQEKVHHFKSFRKYISRTCFHDAFYVLQRWRAGVFFHHNLLLMEKSSLKNLPPPKQIFFIGNSKRRIFNPFKRYLCFFFIEVRQSWPLRVTISSGYEYWGWDNKLDYLTWEVALNICYQCNKNSHLYSKLLNWQRSWFPYCWRPTTSDCYSMLSF